jgi:hypothetical protein
MADFKELLNTAHELLHQKEKLPEKFCHFDAIVESLPPTIPDEVYSLFQDVNEQIRAYNQQFLVLKQELGVLCTKEPGHQDKVTKFFSSFLDLFKLAYTVYLQDPEKLKPFQDLLEKFIVFLKTNTLNLETPLEKGLLLQLTKSAWAYTKTQETMKSVAKQEGGKLKNRTRKQKKPRV